MGMNHYEILGVKQDASTKEIKDAWRKIARATHSDTAAGAGVEHLFLAAKTAYETLSDESSRRQYDASLKVGASSQGSASGSGFADASRGAGSSGRSSSGASRGSGSTFHPSGAPPPPPTGGSPSWGTESVWDSAPSSAYPHWSSQHSSWSPPSKASQGSAGQGRVMKGFPKPLYRPVWGVVLAYLFSLVAVVWLYPSVSAGMNIWGSTFLVVACAIMGLAIYDGRRLRDWKVWAWGIMGAWVVNSSGGGLQENLDVFAFFMIPAVASTLAAWRVVVPAKKRRPKRSSKRERSARFGRLHGFLTRPQKWTPASKSHA